ncbi:MAG: HAMP domain-containing histidine kinase [Lentisphaerae bacterium]|nr:HAMP domain-containing histidine kinase [Lentisphaerota bacterium]
MFWNNLFRSSLKLRLAFAFAILFFISCAIVFFITVSSLVYLKNREDYAELGKIANNVEKIHVIGEKYNSNQIVQPGNSCPEDIKERLLEKYPDSRILYILTQDIPEGVKHKPYKTFFLLRNRRIYEVVQLNENEFSSKLIRPQNDRRTMNRYFLLLLGEYSDENFFIEIINPDGSTYLSSKKLVQHFEDKKEIRNETDEFQTYSKLLPDGKIVKIQKRLYQISAIDPKYTETFFGILALVTIAGILVSWLIATRFIRGVRKMTSEMRLVASSGDYRRKISRRQMDNDHEIRELMETYNDMNEKTLNLMEDLKMVSNNVAHDLRTPITRISGTMEELLRDRTLPDKVVNSCASVTEECLHMKSMINTILDISRINANPDVLQKTDLDLRELSEDFCDIMLPEAERKGLYFKVELPENPVMITADKMCVQRIISNLVENALKFTEQGGVTLSLKELEQHFELSVSDTGCGVSEANISRIFDRFFRGDTSRKYPGNGLGLSLVQAFIKAHDWTIECQSEEGKGTTFLIKIPKKN